MRKERAVDDRGIIELYWKRDEQAIQETADRYGAYCMRISMNILNNRADSDENVNDTYLRAWKSIPPARPASLMAYLAATARNLAINRYKASRAKKRALAAIVDGVSATSWVVPSKGLPGSLKPMCPLRPIPNSCKPTWWSAKI